MISANVSAFSIGKAVGRGGAAVPVPFDLQYAVVAGGGSGGGSNVSNQILGGGGGAGGLLSSTSLTVSSLTAYPVTVGAGGALYNNNGSD